MPVIDISEEERQATPAPALRPEGEPSAALRDTGTWLAGRPVILVVDDDEDSRETIAAMLAGHDISVIQASTGEATLHLAATFALSAIVLDVVLPDRTGFDICRMLREDPATAGIPVVMLTALTALADEVTGVLSGANSYLVKPVSRQTLLRHLEDVI
jgi:DNA-binding response OmpR family regulator